MGAFFETDHLAVGYHGQVLIHDICLSLEKGKILTLIGPNGAGKSTILKSITRQMAALRGTVTVGGQELSHWPAREMAKSVAVMLTDRVRPELMTCAEVVAAGRYPYTNRMGHLTPEDKRIVREAMERVHALELANREFSTLSDGQRQRILLARAICQEPEVIVLDEPTAYLDIRYKIELLDILRSMARQQGTTVILSLHEIDLAMKVSDFLLCVKGETIDAFGPPEQIVREHVIERLYDMEAGAYNLLFGSVELAKPKGTPEVFVVAGAGYGAPFFRQLQKRQIPFAAGILFENDVDTQIARGLSDHVITVPAFSEMTQEAYDAAASILRSCRQVIDAGAPAGSLNRRNAQLLILAKQQGIPVWKGETLP
ncbi:MAG: ABC transporter ATP-binding protein [Firmicutes bacterium]|nr:ABC transporter ATP-binding protein [Bacillota bacterium]